MVLPFVGRKKPPVDLEAVKQAALQSDEDQEFRDEETEENQIISSETNPINMNEAGIAKLHAVNLERVNPLMEYSAGTVDGDIEKDWKNKLQILMRDLRTSNIDRNEVYLIYSTSISLIGYLVESDMPLLKTAGTLFMETDGELLLHCSKDGFQQKQWGKRSIDKTTTRTSDNKFT